MRATADTGRPEQGHEGERADQEHEGGEGGEADDGVDRPDRGVTAARRQQLLDEGGVGLRSLGLPHGERERPVDRVRISRRHPPGDDVGALVELRQLGRHGVALPVGPTG